MKNTLHFAASDLPEPHLERRKNILKAHPEVKELFGNTPITAVYTLFIVALQLGLAVALAEYNFWIMLLVSYIVGAVANHALFVVIHDCAHNLAFKSTNANQLLGIFANLPIVFPSAISFKKYHLIHHRYQGEMELDADLPSPWEAKLVGKSAFGKALWLLFFFLVEGAIRPVRLKSVKLWDGWTVFNVVVELSFLAALTALFGWQALGYLFFSSMFSIGLHPMGARWIQEHFVMKAGQETYSYYGPLNKLMFNVGYHNEHHDLMMVPWSRLPKLKAMAPEFYDSLYSHQSYVALLWKFLFDPSLSLYSRVIRGKGADTLGRPEQASQGYGITAKVPSPS